ncbi:MAG: hypothetical protein WD960_12850 [Gemmatimonadota bacterium]
MFRRGRAALLGAVLLSFLGCGGDGSGGDPMGPGTPDSPDPPANVVGTAGGTVTLAEGAVTLVVPAGALSGDVAITATPISDPDRPEQVVPSSAFTLGPDNVTFAQPARLTIRYDPDEIPERGVEEGLSLGTFVDGAWEEVEGGSVNVGNNTVSGEVSGFSDWGATFVLVPVTYSNTTTGEELPADWVVDHLPPGDDNHVVLIMPRDGSVTVLTPPGISVGYFMWSTTRCREEPQGFRRFTTQYPALGEADQNSVHWDVVCRRSALTYQASSEGMTSVRRVDSDGGNDTKITDMDGPSQWHTLIADPEQGGTFLFNTIIEGSQLKVERQSFSSEWQFLGRDVIPDGFHDTLTPRGGPIIIDLDDPEAPNQKLLFSADGNLASSALDLTGVQILLESEFFDLAPVPYFHDNFNGFLFNRIGPDSPENSGSLMFFDPATGDVSPFYDGFIYPFNVVAPAPDGTVIFTGPPDEEGRKDLWSLDASGGSAVRLTDLWIDAFSPSVSEGGKLAFIGKDDGGKRNIWIMNPDGTEAERITDSGSTGEAPFEVRWQDESTHREFGFGFRF